jgi:DNA-binding MarR family transcriptional regulator
MPSTLPFTELMETRRRAAQVRRGIMRLSRRMRAQRTGEPLSASKLSVLGWLNRKGALTQTALATLERVRPQSLTRILAALDADGLIRRCAGENDRREVVIQLTEAGHAALERDVEQRDAWLGQAMNLALSPDEQALLLRAARLMEKLAEVELVPAETRTEEHIG